MLQNKLTKFLFVFVFFTLVFAASAQTKRKPAKKSDIKTIQTQTDAPEQSASEEPVKKNERPQSQNQSTPTESGSDSNNQTAKTNSSPAKEETKPVYFYEFSQPNFIVAQVFIEHDENGKGKLTFRKKDFSEPISDPIQLSAETLQRVKAAWQALNFLDSTENYQYEKDYSHLGNMKFTMRKDGRERTAKFNYTTNKDAKALADEYRRIEQQNIWIFDVNVARQNQPLETPGMMDVLDGYVSRNEISDGQQLIPFLKELGNDERLPLIARNHAARIIKAIEKQAEKK